MRQFWVEKWLVFMIFWRFWPANRLMFCKMPLISQLIGKFFFKRIYCFLRDDIFYRWILIAKIFSESLIVLKWFFLFSKFHFGPFFPWKNIFNCGIFFAVSCSEEYDCSVQPEPWIAKLRCSCKTVLFFWKLLII